MTRTSRRPTAARRRAWKATLAVVLCAGAAVLGCDRAADQPASALGAAPSAVSGSSPATAAPLAYKEHYRRGLEQLRAGIEEGARAEFEHALDARPDDPDALFQLARLDIQRDMRAGREPRAAANTLEKVILLRPDHIPARLQLADLESRPYPGLARHDDALRQYQALVEMRPDDVGLRLRIVRWLFSAIRFRRHAAGGRVAMDSAWTLDVIRHHLEKAYEIAPPMSEEWKNARLGLARVASYMGEREESIELFRSALADLELGDQDVALIQENIGLDLLELSKLDEAVATLAESYRRVPRLRVSWDVEVAVERGAERPAGVPAFDRGPLLSPPPPFDFHDIAPKLHIDKSDGAGPGAWGDVDGDGDDDLIACGCDTYCALYRNDGDRFRDVSIESGIAGVESGFASVLGDYDNDGDIDLFIGRNGWSGAYPDSLLRNDGGRFTDVAAAAGLADQGPTFHAAWLDYDRDGWLDLVLGQLHAHWRVPNRRSVALYHNRGDGTFEKVTHQAGLDTWTGGGTIGVAVGDVDDDGWPDIFVHGRQGPNALYRNLGGGRFTDIAHRAGVEGPGRQNGYVAFLEDFDADGDLDLVTTSLALFDHVLEAMQIGFVPRPDRDTPRFYRNLGGGHFAEETAAVGLMRSHGTMGAGVADLDNDGYPELYLGTGDPDIKRLEPNVLYWNRGGRRFVDVTREAGVGNLKKGHGVTFVDFDGDGRLELYAQVGGFYHGDFGDNALYRNRLAGDRHWLEVTLTQPGRNHFAVGAAATVGVGDRKLRQDVSGGRGFGTSNPYRLHFGLGADARYDGIDIRWPSGETTHHPGGAGDRRIAISRE